jgi:hypothetical protein
VESTRFRLVRFQPDPIVDSVAETLFAAQIPLRCWYRDVSQQELNLLQFTAGLMAKASASSTKVVRSERLDFTVLCPLLHDTPNDFGTEALESLKEELGPRMQIHRFSQPVLYVCC